MSSREEKALTVRGLRERGYTQGQIGEITGLSRSYVAELLSDPAGERSRARKESYAGVCEACGGPTTGSDGPRKAPRYCAHCSPSRVQKVWTRETCIEAVREWARRRGQAPTATDWITRTVDPDGYLFPPRSAVYSRGGPRDRRKDVAFESWGDMIESAGFPRPRPDRNYIDKHLWEVSNMSAAVTTRVYLVFRVGSDGELWLESEVESRNSVEAIEQAAKEAGRFAAVAKGSLTEYEVKPRLVATAIRNEPTADE